ncbi:MAG: lytic transglycosylase domain-containing protein [Bryobacterales bacterium]|nr:lytic transglycosylase domain-containing protein [Bryobacterales bacterium]
MGLYVLAHFALLVNAQTMVVGNRKATPAQILRSQESSIDRQKASVRRQVMGAVPQATLPEPGAWFTTPWAAPSAGAPANVNMAAASMPIAPAAQDCDPMRQEEVTPLIKEAAGREQIKEELVRAVIERESAFRPCAVSPKGAQGLMQLMPATAAELGVQDPFDARQNINGGTRYLKRLLDRYQGKVELALAAYNAGPGAVDKAGGVPAIDETRAYILNIMNKFAF